MKQKVANYTVILSKEKRAGTNIECYSALVPTLGIATDADTLEKVQEEVKKLIQFHLGCLANEGEKIPVEEKSILIARSEVYLPENAQIASN